MNRMMMKTPVNVGEMNDKQYLNWLIKNTHENKEEWLAFRELCSKSIVHMEYDSSLASKKEVFKTSLEQMSFNTANMVWHSFKSIKIGEDESDLAKLVPSMLVEQKYWNLMEGLDALSFKIGEHKSIVKDADMLILNLISQMGESEKVEGEESVDETKEDIEAKDLAIQEEIKLITQRCRIYLEMVEEYEMKTNEVIDTLNEAHHKGNISDMQYECFTMYVEKCHLKEEEVEQVAPVEENDGYDNSHDARNQAVLDAKGFGNGGSDE